MHPAIGRGGAIGGEPLEAQKLTVNLPRGGSQTMLVNARKFSARHSGTVRILVTFYTDAPSARAVIRRCRDGRRRMAIWRMARAWACRAG